MAVGKHEVEVGRLDGSNQDRQRQAADPNRPNFSLLFRFEQGRDGFFEDGLERTVLDVVDDHQVKVIGPQPR